MTTIPERLVDDRALARVLDEFAATVTGDFSVQEILRQLAEGVMRVLQLDGAGVTTPQAGGKLLRAAFATSAPVQELENLQELLQNGPCTDAHHGRRVISIADLSVEGSWPAYQRRAVELGMRAVAAVPLFARGFSWGVLDVYRSAPVALSEQELAAVRTLANLATSYLVVTADRDTARIAQHELAHRAMHDPLTGLPARWVFLDRLAAALQRSGERGGCVGVMFLDLDGLKYVNDTFGHSAGDDMLTTCANRVQAALGPLDVLARLGGDEFGVLLEGLTSPQDAHAVADQIMRELTHPYTHEGHVLQPSASLGLVMTDDSTTSGDTLIAHADAAMYRAKQAGRGRWVEFDPVAYALDRRSSTVREQLTGELRVALRTGQLELHYQPIFDLGAGDGTGAVYAVEALARWRHPERGLLPAGAFIDALVAAGLSGQLGSWAIATACRQMASWEKEFGDLSPQRVFVNVSVSELVETDLPGRVATELQLCGLAADRLTIEITETGLITQADAVQQCIDALRALGCELAIDDFGTGYSSLSRLVQIPASTLKVDQSFTSHLLESRDAAAVVSAVLLIGANLRRTVIVEGVETATTAEALVELGATHLQGYLLAMPMHPDDLSVQLREQPWQNQPDWLGARV